MDSMNEPEALYVDVFPLSWIVEGHGIGVSGIEPAD
jgi:hypothetical protein